MATLKSKQKRRQLVALVAIVIIAASVGGSGILSMGARNASLPAFTQTHQIMDGPITIEPGSFKYFEFSVPVQIKNAAVKGAFTSTGSSDDNDIVVSIVPEVALQSINEGKAYPAFYFSGKVETGKVDAALQDTGIMYVIIDNRFSETSKAVDLNLELEY